MVRPAGSRSRPGTQPFTAAESMANPEPLTAAESFGGTDSSYTDSFAAEFRPGARRPRVCQDRAVRSRSADGTCDDRGRAGLVGPGLAAARRLGPGFAVAWCLGANGSLVQRADRDGTRPGVRERAGRWLGEALLAGVKAGSDGFRLVIAWAAAAASRRTLSPDSACSSACVPRRGSAAVPSAIPGAALSLSPRG